MVKSIQRQVNIQEVSNMNIKLGKSVYSFQFLCIHFIYICILYIYMISEILGSKSRAELFSLFFLNEFRGSIRSAAKECGFSPMQVRSELIKLENMGILKEESIANSKIYSLNEQCNFAEELRALITKTSGFDTQIKKAISKVKGIELAFIYGSYASGNFGKNSDIDLFIIGTPDMEKLNSVLFKLERKLNRQINLSIYSRPDFLKKKDYGFVKNVLVNKKIMLFGDENGLSRA